MKSKDKIDICIALGELLYDKSFEEIIVKDITIKSGYSRATFYRNFEDKYDVMNYSYVYEVDKLIEQYGDDNEAIINKKLEYIQENSDYFKEAFKFNGQNSFTNFIYEYSINYLKEYKKSGLIHYSQDESEVDTLLIYIGSRSIAIVNNWIKGNLKESAQWVGNQIYSYLPEALKVNRTN